MSILDATLKLIAALGAINWGLVALFNFNIVEYFCNFFSQQALVKYIHIFIAISGFYSFISVFKS